MKITKRNGNVVVYDDEKIANSILKANAETQGEPLSSAAAAGIADEVIARLADEKEIISTQDVRQCVHELLWEMGLRQTAERYSQYKK